jgi:predicted transcriptional regulator
LEKLSSLLFELANEDRLKILFKLQDKPLRLTQISDKLNLTVQETSRHLSRLSGAKLITKDPDGQYCLLSYGENLLKLFPGFEFLTEHRDYFNTHSISHLPEEFLNRIGELENCAFTDDVFAALHLAENLIQEANEYIWIIGNQVLMSTLPLLEEAIKRSATFRLILPEDLIPPPGFKPLPYVAGRIERRTLKQVDVIIMMSEKEARVAFPTRGEKMDPSAFASVAPRPHKWCKDLYEYYWNKAQIGRPTGYPSSN